MTMTRTLLAGCMLAMAATAAQSQGTKDATSYPQQTVRIVVPFGAGTTTDILARSIAEKLTEKWPHPVIVENRAGIAGAGSVAQSKADGHTLLLTSNGHTIIGAGGKTLPFDPVKSFAGIARVGSVPFAMVVSPSLEAKDLKELVATIKKKPGGYSFSSAGAASASYLVGELFRQAAGLDMVHVPYKGGADSLMSTIRGDTQLNFNVLGVVLGAVRGDKARLMAIAAPERSPAAPDVPTFEEAGLFEYNAWFGLLAPAGTPHAIIDKINADALAALKMPDIQARLQKANIIQQSSTPAQMDETLRADTARFGKVLDASPALAK